ncbi:MAG TPA: penicillin-binding protein activator LpoB [Candidatus Krumholzibacteria bacterium]|nr:penicillin-binding protein activator LpoB [Candidatus Krumholzibacteria bacterium]HPD72550.1 penicillin-binding protein activator LpoB [Candidatus Krumholzibacteria bacterium]HRY40518.1 penicillin-binding protein activator LpoB [Candidatus Krumholzibacteria bacterium]
MTTRVYVASLALLAVVLVGCGGKTVTRVDPGEQIDLSGNWNDIDSQNVAQDLVSQITSADWVERHLEEKGERPTLIVGVIRNKTVEHIPMKTLTADLERTFIGSGRVEVVASPEERDQIREERADQQDYASAESMAQWGREHGADYMLLGELNTIVDQEGKDQVKYYQTDTYLVNLENNVKVWAGQTKTKKVVSNKKYRG